MHYLLQQYDDGTFGYKGIDDIEENGIGYGKQIILEQSPNETRKNFIIKNVIVFKVNQYGSDEMKDKLVNKVLFNGDSTIIELGYGIDKIIQIRNYDLFVKFINNCEEKDAEKYVNCPDKNIRKYIARKGFCLDKLIHDENSEVREEVA